MSVLIQNNNTFTLSDMTGSHEKLPVGNYSLQFDERMGYYLKQQEPFKMPLKLYGNFDFIDRWIKSYQNNSEKNLGILLSGLKGTGKTVAAQLFTVKINYPVIFITNDHHGPDFEAFLSNPVFNNTIIFIDEFEKIYSSEEESNSLLTLMDGMYHTKLIFLLTANDPSRINQRLQNRLNRIKYHRIYDKLDPDTIEQVVDDLLIRTEWRKSIETFIDRFDMLTMDVLTSVIKEVNLFNEDALECAKHLNLIEEPEYYKISVIHKDTEIRCEGQYVNYRKQPVRIEYYHNLDDRQDLLETLPDYTDVRVTEYPYVVKNGVVLVDYKDGVKIKLMRNEFSLAF